MKNIQDSTAFPAQVPGSVYSDLLKNNQMADPYYGDNELKALALMDKDYEYETLFSCFDEIFNSEEVLLIFDGIDTIADIYLNSHHLGHTENMHRRYEFSVKAILQNENNLLRVVLHSPTRYIKEENKKDFWPAVHESMEGTTHIRKAQYMFGWDWGARLPDAGIFRPVTLEGYDHARIDSFYVNQMHHQGVVTLKLDIDIACIHFPNLQRTGSDDDYLKEQGDTCKVRIIDPEGTIICEGRNQSEFTIQHPHLWWPAGMGSQPLYTVEVSLWHGSVLLDSAKKRIGLRTLTINRTKDKYGESFAHEVNGLKFFAMGADYVPEDHILSRITPGRTRNLLMQAKAANMNCIRVWGGGYYPDNYFFDICDELGLVVWMDFMFACAIYRLPEDFEENITVELIQNIKRIRNHACLGIWCGNNEIEGFMCSGNLFATKDEYKADYIKIFEYLIPKLVKKYDPETFYWPSSPSSGGAFHNTQNGDSGDTHYWDVWHGNKPFADYRKYYFRYLSEFGFQSFPSPETIRTFTEEADRNIFSYIMEKHQRNVAANGKIMNYMEQTYLYPTNFEILIYASQLLQAEAIRYGVEHFRRNRGRCMGTIIWQLNDSWPVASWSSIDYFGRWKALHYFAKRFFSPLLLSCEEEGALTEDANPNAEPYKLQKSIRLCVTNDSMKKEHLTVCWKIRDAYAKTARSESTEIDSEPLSCFSLPKLSLPELDEYNQYVSYELMREDEIIGSGTVLFTVPKFFHFQDPHLTVREEKGEIVVSAKTYAKGVMIRNSDDDLILSDNFFDMNAGEKHVRIIKGKPKELAVRSIFDIR